MTHNVCAEARPDSLATIHKNHRDDWCIVYRLNRCSVVIEIRSIHNRQLREHIQRVTLLNCVNIYLSDAESSPPCSRVPNWPRGSRQVYVVRTNKILRHSNDCPIETLLSMMIATNFRDRPTELCDLNLIGKFAS